MPPPTPEEQIRFLTNIQRLLAEGAFVATYKYALLTALADLAVELGDDSAPALRLPLFAIAEKFVEYYWRHAMPYTTTTAARVLKQNTGGQAKILSLILSAWGHHGDSLAAIMRDNAVSSRLVRGFILTLKEQPLWRLQIVGCEKLDFLYGPGETGDYVEL